MTQRESNLFGGAESLHATVSKLNDLISQVEDKINGKSQPSDFTNVAKLLRDETTYPKSAIDGAVYAARTLALAWAAARDVFGADVTPQIGLEVYDRFLPAMKSFLAYELNTADDDTGEDGEEEEDDEEEIFIDVDEPEPVTQEGRVYAQTHDPTD
jgi:hypothetical protein